VIVCVLTVNERTVRLAKPVPSRLLVPRTVDPSLNVTVPVGMIEAPVTMAAKETLD
jgi:hypothetical protein